MRERRRLHLGEVASGAPQKRWSIRLGGSVPSFLSGFLMPKGRRRVISKKEKHESEDREALLNQALVFFLHPPLSMSSPASSAVRTQLTRALILLIADAKAAKVPLPVPFLQKEDWSSSSSSTSSSSTSTFPPSSSSNPQLLRAALGDDANDLDGERERERAALLMREREHLRGFDFDEEQAFHSHFRNHEKNQYYQLPLPASGASASRSTSSPPPRLTSVTASPFGGTSTRSG